MPGDQILKAPPESTNANAIKIAVHEVDVGGAIGEVKVPYVMIADTLSYVVPVIDSVLAANKTHLTIFNNSTTKIRIRKIVVCINVTGNINGSACVFTVDAIGAAPTGGTTTTIRKLNSSFIDLDANIVARINNPTATPIFAVAGGTLFVDETSNIPQITLFEKTDSVSSLQLNQGEGIMIRQGSLGTVGAVNIFLYLTKD